MINTVQRLWRLLDRQARLQFGVVFLLILIGSGLEVIGIGLIFPILKIVSDPADSMTSMPLLNDIFHALGFSSNIDFLIALCLCTFAVFLGKNVFVFVVSYFQHKFVWGQRAVLSNRLFSKYLNAPYEFFLQRDTSGLLRNVTQSVQELFGSVVMPVMMIGTELLVVVSILSFLLWMEPKITLLTCVVLTGFCLIFYFKVRHYLLDWGKRLQITNKGRLQWATQAFSGIKAIKALGQEKFFLEGYNSDTNDNSAVRMKLAVLNQLPRASLETFAIGILLLVIPLILLQDRNINEFLPMLGVFGLAVIRIIPSFNRISTHFNSLRFGTASLDNIYEDAISFEELNRTSERNLEPLNFHKELVLSNVSFYYPSAKTPAIQGIDLSITRGESVALVGPSGAGKSTLADLIMGLLSPESGVISVDGVTIGGNVRDWRANIGYIPQELFLMNDSLLNNIALGVSDDQIDNSKLHLAIELAQLTDFIDSLPLGLQTNLGDRGIKVSGGQRQRIAIARALYHEPEVLILDEATSSLDPILENEITASIDSLSGLKTLVVIAHRLTTVQNCDKVVLMEGGKIIDTGKFHELRKKSADFDRLVKLSDLKRTSRFKSG